MERFRTCLCACLTGVVLVSACRSSPSQSPPQSPPPDVLVVVVDALRADAVGPRRDSATLTPNLDRLAAEGVAFDRAWSPSTWTKPAIASLFTGVSPRGHGVRLVATPGGKRLVLDTLGADLMTLAERFQLGGYSTGAVVNQVHLSPKDGFAAGFDGYAHLRGAAAPRLVRLLLRWFDKEPRRPFFAYLHLLDPHWPYNRRLKGSTKPPLEGAIPPCVSRTAAAGPECIGEVERWLASPSGRRDVQALRRRYEQEVEYIDHALARLFDGLRAKDLWENTIVVVTSDHGEGFAEHAWMEHGFPPYEEVARIPLLMRLPARLRPARTDIPYPVSLVDLYPTLLDLAGLDVPSQLDGRSVAPWLGEGAPPRRVFFVGSLYGSAALDGRWKLVRLTTKEERFYDLWSDPLERDPLPCTNNRRCSELRRRLAGELRREPLLRPGYEELSAEEKQELEALGYL